MKIDTELLQEVLQTKNLPNDTVRSILDDVIAKVNENKTPKPKTPRKPFVLLVSDPNGVIPADTELVGWTFQLDDGVSVNNLMPNIHKVAGIFNSSKKGLSLPAKTVGDLIEAATSKTFSECGVYRKHKEAVFVIVTDNQLPST